MPVEELDTILFGNGTQDGVNTYIDERRQADQGGNGLGRLTAPALAGTNVTLAGEAPATMPFGAKMTGATTSSGNANVAFTPAAGAAPATLAIDFTGQPNVGQTVTINFDLPNG